MTFEYIVDKDKKHTMTESELKSLVNRISSDFDNYNSRRSINLDMANALIDEIFFKKHKPKKSNEDIDKVDSEEAKYESWKTKVKMCKVFMFYQVLKAFIWKNIYSNVNSMFDVSGENQEADNDSNKQKAALVDILEKMEYTKICDKTMDYALIYGEMIHFCSWKKKLQEFRRKVGYKDLTNPKAIQALMNGKFFYNDEKVIYDNPFIYAVNPANFVFDAAQKENWDECPKIYRTWKVPDDIINNKYYKISKDVAKQIREEVDTEVDSSNSQLDSDLEYETKNGKTVEVLEHWGNLTLTDGTVLKNWHAVVVARKHIVRFEKNKRIINPFTYGSFVNDPETQRGISPLYCTVSLAQLQEDLMNRTCDMQTLQECPPIYAPKGFFRDDEIKLYPGKVIEYGDNLSPNEIKQMEFSVSVFLNDITFLSDMMAEVSGIFPNMAGADERTAKTATEISTKAQGQLTRLSMLIDTINQDMIVADVKKIAKLNADFKSGEETIFVTKGDKKETITVNDQVRQAEYRYTYSDRTATTERSNKADLIVQAVREFAQYIPLNVPEIFTWYMEQKDVENPERFLQNEDTIPIEIQQLLLQDPRIKELSEQFRQNQQNQPNGNNEQPAQQNVIPDSSIPQAQVQE